MGLKKTRFELPQIPLAGLYLLKTQIILNRLNHFFHSSFIFWVQPPHCPVHLLTLSAGSDWPTERRKTKREGREGSDG
jgi:hypothetical protein